MKTLFVLRHAKSSWDDPELKDFARPLAARGLEDIPLMASRFVARGLALDGIVSSPALRTQSTASLWAGQVGLDASCVTSNPELYFAGAPMLLRAASLFDDERDSVMLVGHNPAITDFVNDLASLEIENVPTCGLLHFELAIDHWQQIAPGKATLIDFDYPKRQLPT